MSCLSPNVLHYMKQGYFSVQRKDDNLFSKIAFDHLIETTINKDTKNNRGGMKHFKKSESNVNKWIGTQAPRGQICRTLLEVTKLDTATQHKQLSIPRIQRDSSDVESIISSIKTFFNPFDNSNADLTHIHHLTSGLITNESTTASILSAYDQGEQLYTTFVNERILSSKKDFYDRIKLIKLLPFYSKAKTLPVYSKQEKNDSELRLLHLARDLKLDLQETVNYPLVAIPPSIALPDGTLRKTNKAKLIDSIKRHKFIDEMPSFFLFKFCSCN